MIGGDLVLGSASVLDFELGAPGLAPGNGSDLIAVTGDLTLDGTLNVTALPGFGSGLYRLINYGGALTNNGLEFGTVPTGFESTGLMLDVATAGQVNLLAAATDPVLNFIFWDGANTSANGQIDGGSGTWNTASTNWTIADGSANGAFDQDDFLIFRGPSEPPQQAGVHTVAAVTPSASAGTVTISEEFGRVRLANGVQFAVTGYTVTGDRLTLQTGDINFRVGDGGKAGESIVATIAAPITGSGRLVKTDFGALVLTGANNYDGGTTVMGGLLQGDTTSLQGDIDVRAEGRLLFNQAATGTFADVLTGTGMLGKEGSGTLVLSGNSGTFGGETQVAQGTLLVNGTLGNASSSLEVGSGATLGGTGTIGGAVAVADGILAPGTSPGTLTIGGNLSLTAASVLNYELGAPVGGSGAASDLVNVGGNLTLDGTLNVSGGTGFGAGLYRLLNYGGTLTDNGLTLGSLPGSPANLQFAVDVATAGQVNLLTVAPDFAFIFWDGGQAQANGLIDGGTGTWSVANTNWTTDSGNANGAFDPADFLIFRAPEADQGSFVRTLAAASPSASTGTVTVDNSGGQVTLANGVQFATGGYTVTGGSIRLAAPGNGPVTVRVGDGTTDGAAFVATIDSALTGTSGLAKTDLGTLILSGANTYSGGTSVANGTLQGTATSLQGAIAVEEEGTLLFNQTANGTYAGVLSGQGSVIKEGAGVLTLSGNSSLFGGAARLEQGGIALSGQLGGSLTTLAGTTLTGSGESGSIDLSGTIAPANSIGLFTVDGDMVFRAGSTYQVELAANGTGDRITVDGDVSILGGTVSISLLDPETNYLDGTSWTIVDSEGLTGTFAGISESSAFLDFALGYTGTTAFLTLDVIRQFPDVALTFNQRQASLGLMELDRTAGGDGLAVYNALLLLDGDSARAAFDMTSGEIYADILASGLRSVRERLAMRQVQAMSRGEEGWQLWLAGGLSDGHVNGDGNGARFTRSGTQVEFGADYHGPDNAWAMGLSGGWAWADVDNAARASEADLDGLFLTGFARKGDFGPGMTVSVAGSYARAGGTVARAIAFPGIARTAGAEVTSSARAVSLDLRYGFDLGSVAVGPAAGVESARSRIGAYAEGGAGALNLAGGGSVDRASRISVGGFASWIGTSGAVVLDARYVDGELDNSLLSHTMAGSPRTFAVLPARGSANGARVSGTAEFGLGNGLSLGASAAAFFAGDESEVHASARIRFAF